MSACNDLSPNPPESTGHIEITPGVCGGKPRLAGTRIRVQDVVIWHERMSLSADEIASKHPQASLSAIYAALTYYHDHRAQIDDDMRRGDALVEEMRRAYPLQVGSEVRTAGMTDRIRFHCDENVDPAVADGLRRRGVEATTPGEVGLIGASDEEHLAFAIAEQRVIITHDEDFLSLAQSGTSHCGIAYCHVQSRSIDQILGGLLLIHDCLTPENMRNHIEFL